MRQIILVALALLLSLPAFSADYDAMWKAVSNARGKDMPRQAVAALDKIIIAAEKEQCHGEMLAAMFHRLQIMSEISADSIVPAVEKIVSMAERAECDEATMDVAAVYYTVLAKWASLSENTVSDSMCIRKALAHPGILAQTKAAGYERIADFPDTDEIYQNDLLSLIGHELRQFAFLKDYYHKHGNRRAACMELYYETTQGVYDNADNSLTQKRMLLRKGLMEYADVPEVALLSMAYYDLMQDNDISDAARYIYLNDAISKYTDICTRYNCNQYLNALRNAQLTLTCPRFGLSIMRSSQPDSPKSSHCIMLPDMRNVSEVNIDIMPLKADGRLKLDPADKRERAQLLSLVNGQTTKIVRRYTQPSWQMHSDTICCPALPQGVYLVRAKADGLETYTVWYNTDIAVLYLPLSRQQQRMIVVSATTGRTIPYANIVLSREDYRGNVMEERTLRSDKKGEVVFDKPFDANKVYAYTETDKAFRKTHYYSYFNIRKTVEKRHILTLFTDRAVYRPGQKVKGCVVMHNAADVASMHAIAEHDVVISLRNTQSEEVFSDTVKTNSEGNASFEILLPAEGRNGNYTLTAYAPNACSANAGILVEEYKRPTFEVKSCEDYRDVIAVDVKSHNLLSSDADTVLVRFIATDYSGVPVHNASVSYSIMRRQDWFGWWRRVGGGSKAIVESAVTQTDADGVVSIPLPLLLPEVSTGTYAFDVKVSVTYHNGETQESAVTIRARKRGQIAEENKVYDAPLPDFEVSASTFPNDGSGIVFTMRRNRKGCDNSMPVLAYYTIISENGVVESGRCEFDTLYTRTFKYDKKYGEGLTIAYSWIQNGEVHEYVRTLLRPLPDMKLHATWSSFRDRTQPGSDESWTLHIADSPRYSFIASVYDRSIDALMPSSWIFTPHRNYYATSIAWQAKLPQVASCYTSESLVYHRTYVADYARIRSFYYPASRTIMKGGMPILMRSRVTMAAAESVSNDSYAEESGEMRMAKEEMRDETGDGRRGNGESINTESDDLSKLVRTEFGETAFFGVLSSEANGGDVTLSFRMPQTVTTWRVRGFAYDSIMRHCFVDTICIAAKQLIVKPNIPRFLRQHDSSVMTAEVQNATQNEQHAEVVMQLLDMQTDSIFWQQTSDVRIAADSSVTVSCEMPAIEQDNTLIFRIVARTADGMSDGEQHFIPVIPATEVIAVTRAFTQHGAGEYTTDIADMVIDGSTDRWLRVKYTEDAAQMIAEAIPQSVSPSSRDALSLASAVYVMRMFSLPDMSDVKKGLSQLQNADGSWPWWSGMRGSAHVTTSVARLLARLSHYGLSDAETEAMLQKAMPYLLKELGMEAAELRRLQQKNPKMTLMPSSTAVDILYICAMTGGRYDNTDRGVQRDIRYLISLTEKRSASLSLYSKAQMAVIHAMKGSRRQSLEYIQSLKEYSVYTPEAGRYYDAPRAEYSWRNYRIPTEVAVIEAMRIITPEDTQTIEEMLRWLLHEKRTQQWDNSLNTADAIYAFMQSKEQRAGSAEDGEDTARIMFDGRLLDLKNGVADIPLPDDITSATLSVDKSSTSTSWGALILEQRAPLTSIGTQGEGFNVKREIICHDAASAVGSKVTVRITVTAQRDYDFVEVCDNRPACLQPVQQLSGYYAAQSSTTARYSYAGYYRVTGDNATTYYFDRLAKGKHVIETDYYIDRKGTYSTGLTTVKSSYAPEFSGTASGSRIGESQR